MFKYDNIGRILQTRRGDTTFDGFTDNNYFYFDSTNRLESVSTKQDSNNYAYDSSGNMTGDKSKDMLVSYDWRDMPVQFKLRKDSINSWATVNIVYDASGNRVLKD